MQYYKSFTTEALELSQTLPEEESELYKRHFVPIPLQKFADRLSDAEVEDEDPVHAEISYALLKNFAARFDAVIGSTTHAVTSRDKPIRVVNLDELDEEHLNGKLYTNRDHRLVAFIHAHSKRLVYINVPDGQKVDMNLLFVNTDNPLVTQVLVSLGREAKLNLFEWYASRTGPQPRSQSLMSVLHEVTVGPYAMADIGMVHNEDERTYVVNFSKGKVHESGNLKMNHVYNGGLCTRAKNDIDTVGYAATTNLIELVLGAQQQKFDLNTTISNMAQNTVAGLESKAALMDSAACILKGFANVGEAAKGSRSYVNERGILLDKTAYMSSIPGMSINNANVKATHSSATAPMEEELLFYLMSRGTDKITATKMLVAGFLSGSLAKMENPVLKQAVSSLIAEKINTRRFGDVPKLDVSSIWAEHHEQAADLFGGHYKYRELK